MTPVAQAPRTSVTDEAIGRIRQMIVSGALHPGDRLPPEAELATSLGLSRTSLREAVRALSFLNVLDTRQGDGTFVSNLGPGLLLDALELAVDLQRGDALLDILRVRRILEPAATGLAATRITPPQVAELRAMIPAGPAEDVEHLVDTDLAFHRAIARAGGNGVLVSLLDGLAGPTVRLRVWRGLSEADSTDRTLVEHTAIVDALAAGDADLAHAASTVHIAGVQKWMASALAVSGGEQPRSRGGPPAPQAAPPPGTAPLRPVPSRIASSSRRPGT